MGYGTLVNSSEPHQRSLTVISVHLFIILLCVRLALLHTLMRLLEISGATPESLTTAFTRCVGLVPTKLFSLGVWLGKLHPTLIIMCVTVQVGNSH